MQFYSSLLRLIIIHLNQNLNVVQRFKPNGIDFLRLDKNKIANLFY